MPDDDNKIEIRVSMTTSCKDLAGSIVAAFCEGKEITLSCIGPNPVNNAVKAVCIANRTLAPRGIILNVVPGLINRKIYNQQLKKECDWTITVFRVRNLLEGSFSREAAAEILKAAAGGQ
jgi:stage V sporulation protein SpoVS